MRRPRDRRRRTARLVARDWFDHALTLLRIAVEADGADPEVTDELENLALHSDTLVASTVPGSAAEALSHPNWKAPMQREYDSLMMNEVW